MTSGPPKRHGSALVAASHPGHFEYRLGGLGTSCYLGVQLRLQMSMSENRVYPQ